EPRSFIPSVFFKILYILPRSNRSSYIAGFSIMLHVSDSKIVKIESNMNINWLMLQLISSIWFNQARLSPRYFHLNIANFRVMSLLWVGLLEKPKCNSQ
ncbi:hypothetical protein HN873_006099, partial [Arachis hypogaea]